MEFLNGLLGNRSHGADYQEISGKSPDEIHQASNNSCAGSICAYVKNIFSLCSCPPTFESEPITLRSADLLENKVINYISAIKSEQTSQLIKAVKIMNHAIKSGSAISSDCEVLYTPDGILARVTSLDPATKQPVTYLGNGNYKAFELALKQTKEANLTNLFPVALARVTKDKLKKHSVLTEGFKVHAYINHPRIVKLYGSFEYNDTLYVQLEYLNGGDLLNMVLSPTEAFLKQRPQIIEHILMALEYLERVGIRHRDIKLENFILEIIDENYTCKLSDFDWATSPAKELESYLNNQRVYGSYHYVCPQIAELLLNCKAAKQKTKEEAASSKSDIWSGGVCIFGILYGGFPPYINTKLTNQQLLGEISKVSRSTIREIFKDKPGQTPQLVKRMLNPNAHKRITAKEALSNFQGKK